MLKIRFFHLMCVVLCFGCGRTSPQPSSTGKPVAVAVANTGAVPFDTVLFTGTIDAVGLLDDDSGATIAVGQSQNIRVVVSVDSLLQGGAPFASGDVVSFGVERWSMLCAGSQYEAIGKRFRLSLTKHASDFRWLIARREP